MGLNLTFHQMKPRDEVRTRAEVLYGKMERFLEAASDTQLTIGVEHGKAVVTLVVVSRGETHKASEEHDDLRTAMDKLFHTMEVQLRRAKERRTAGRHDVESQDGFDA